MSTCSSTYSTTVPTTYRLRDAGTQTTRGYTRRPASVTTRSSKRRVVKSEPYSPPAAPKRHRTSPPSYESVVSSSYVNTPTKEVAEQELRDVVRILIEELPRTPTVTTANPAAGEAPVVNVPVSTPVNYVIEYPGVCNNNNSPQPPQQEDHFVPQPPPQHRCFTDSVAPPKPTIVMGKGSWEPKRFDAAYVPSQLVWGWEWVEDSSLPTPPSSPLLGAQGESPPPSPGFIDELLATKEDW